MLLGPAQDEDLSKALGREVMGFLENGLMRWESNHLSAVRKSVGISFIGFI